MSLNIQDVLYPWSLLCFAELQTNTINFPIENLQWNDQHKQKDHNNVFVDQSARNKWQESVDHVCLF